MSRVYLVATGETHEGQETYTRHDTRPPLCDAEVLYTASAPQQAQETSLPPWPTSFSYRYSEAAPSQPPQGAEADRIVRMVLGDMEICAGESPHPDWESQELSTETVEALIAYEKAARFNSEAEQSALQHRSAAPSHPLFPCLIGYVSAETVKSLQNAEWLSQRGVSAQLWGTDSPPSRATIPVYLLAQQADTRAALAAPPQGASSPPQEPAARCATCRGYGLVSRAMQDGSMEDAPCHECAPLYAAPAPVSPEGRGGAQG